MDFDEVFIMNQDMEENVCGVVVIIFYTQRIREIQ